MKTLKLSGNLLTVPIDRATNEAIVPEPDLNTPFALRLRNNMRLAVQKAGADGTVSMSYGNFYQVIRTPNLGYNGAPVRLSDYLKLFGAICDADEVIKAFVVESTEW